MTYGHSGNGILIVGDFGGCAVKQFERISEPYFHCVYPVFAFE